MKKENFNNELFQFINKATCSSTIFKEICKKANVPFQDYSSRNDMATGSTLSGLCVRHVSIDSIDVGISQLAVHSANEVVGDNDPLYIYNAFKKSYDVSFNFEHDFMQTNEIQIDLI